MKSFFRKLGDGIDRTFGSLRSSVDITFWDSSGNSAFGLRRCEAKVLAWVFIILGLSMADPPGGLIPVNDFFNLWLSGFLSQNVGVFPMGVWLLLTYTVFAWSLIIFGAFIHPRNTGMVLNGLFDKIRKGVKSALKSPLVLFVSSAIFYVIFLWYKSRLGL